MGHNTDTTGYATPYAGPRTVPAPGTQTSAESMATGRKAGSSHQGSRNQAKIALQRTAKDLTVTHSGSGNTLSRAGMKGSSLNKLNTYRKKLV